MNVESPQLNEMGQQDARLLTVDALTANPVTANTVTAKLAPNSDGVNPANTAIVKRYGFRIDGIQLLAPKNAYCELIPDFHPSPLPNAPDHVLGLINLRGNLIPVYQLGHKQEQTRRRTYALLIGQVKTSAALVIDEKPRAISLPDTSETTQAEALPQWLGASVTDAVIVNGERWHNLNASKLFQLLAQR